MMRDKKDENMKRMASLQSLSNLDKGNFLGLWDRGRQPTQWDL